MIKKGLKAVAYTRVSTDDQISIPAQIEVIKTHCTRNGWFLLKVFSDKKSGRNTEREGLKQCLDFIHERENKQEPLVLIVYDTDRIARNLLDLQTIAYSLSKEGVIIYTTNEGFQNLDDPSGKLLFDIRGAIAEWEIKQILRRSKMGMDYKAKKGETQNRVPRGYKKEDGKVIIDENEAWKIKAIFYERYKEKTSFNKIATRYLIPKSSVMHFLKNPYFLGYITYKGELIKGVHEPIITEEMQKELRITINPHTNKIEQLEEIEVEVGEK